MVARRPVWLLAVVSWGCAPAPLSIAPGARGMPACPIDGCNAGPQNEQDAGAAPASCDRGGTGACAGRPARECTQAALARWGSAEDRRTLECVSRMFEEACTAKDPQACHFAGRLALEGHGVERNVQRGLDLLEQSCEQGVAMACAVGDAWLSDGSHASEVDDATERRTRLEAQQSCLLGQMDACYDLGLSYYFGREAFPMDRSRAAQAYERACDLGDTRACNNLGDALTYADGAARDVARAASLFARACHHGEALGCANLGYMLEHGEGIARDVPRARGLYRDACQTGEIYGCLHYDLLAAVAAGAPSAPAQALEHWRRGCEGRRDARSCAFVGLLYEDGPDGQARDEAKSQEAMSRACKLGESRACEWIKARVEE